LNSLLLCNPPVPSHNELLDLQVEIWALGFTFSLVLCSNGRIDMEELGALLQSVEGGLQPVTLVRALCLNTPSQQGGMS
jgi:hypothetical protein